MKIINFGKVDIVKVVLVVFSIVLVILWVFTINQKSISKLNAEGLTHIETISSNVQRVSKLELEGNNDDELIKSLYEVVILLSPVDGSSSKFFAENDEITLSIKEYADDFHLFSEAIIKFRENADRDAMFSASERHYENSSKVIKSVSEYSAEFTKSINTLDIAIVANVLLIAGLLIKILLDTVDELKKNKEMSKEMFIDTSTGLYNRSKCQEVLKTPLNMEELKQRAIIIFDLNDLKKTNDLLGHRAGDDLISSFALQLRDATKIFSDEVFVGRYGGDEFMAYFASANEEDVKMYLEEVDFLMNSFNENAGKQFALSCAAGYSITTNETKDMAMRDLFDDADANMYTNKIAMKEKKKQDLLAKGVQIEEEVDDRL